MSDCLKCGGKTDVKETRLSDHGLLRRRRKCRQCGFKFSTREIPYDHDSNATDIVTWAADEAMRIARGEEEPTDDDS